MKIKLEIPHAHSVVIDVNQDSGVLLKALSEARLVTSTGYGKDLKWHEAEISNRLTFEIVADSFFAAPHDAIAKLTKENEQTSNRWLKEYQQRQNVEKELKELKEKISGLGIEIK